MRNDKKMVSTVMREMLNMRAAYRGATDPLFAAELGVDQSTLKASVERMKGSYKHSNLERRVQLIHLIEALDMEISQAAVLCGVTYSSIYSWLRGDRAVDPISLYWLEMHSEFYSRVKVAKDVMEPSYNMGRPKEGIARYKKMINEAVKKAVSSATEEDEPSIRMDV